MILSTTIVVHSASEARAALEAARRDGIAITLQSPPAAAGYHGIGWWLALTERLAEESPGVVFEAVLECGTAAGFALEALRAGVKTVRVDAPSQAMAALKSMAASLGGKVLEPAPSLRGEGHCGGKGEPAGPTWRT